MVIVGESEHKTLPHSLHYKSTVIGIVSYECVQIHR